MGRPARPRRVLILGLLMATVVILLVVAACLLPPKGAPRPSDHWRPILVADSRTEDDGYRLDIALSGSDTGWILLGGLPYARGSRPPLLRTDDYGENLIACSPVPVSGIGFGLLEVARDGTLWVFDGAIALPRFHVTTDGGITWTSTDPVPLPRLVGFSPLSSAEAWAFSAEYLIHTTDGGKTWTSQMLGEKDDSRWRLLSVDFYDRHHGSILVERGSAHAGWTVAVFTTDDGGQSFHVVEVPEATPGGLMPYHLHLTSEKQGWAAISRALLLHTEDGGQSWTVVSPHVEGSATDACLLDVAFPTPEVGWAVGDRPRWGLFETRSQGVVLETRDGGKTWREIDAGVTRMENSRFERVVFRDERHGWLMGTGGLHPSDMRIPPRESYDIEFILRYEP